MGHTTLNFIAMSSEHIVDKRDVVQSSDEEVVPKVQVELFRFHRWGFADLAFLLVSFGYMLPWTSLGSLISYYKYTYGANFYVTLYCAYYLPGLPVSICQQYFDSAFERRFSSRIMFLLRGTICFLLSQIILVLLLWFNNQSIIVAMFCLLGVLSWYCHGQASVLASLFPSSCIASLQTGFRTPEIYSLSFVTLLQLGRNPLIKNLHIFYIITSFMMSFGLISWIYLINCKEGIYYLNKKDNSSRLKFSDPPIPSFWKEFHNDNNNDTSHTFKPIIQEASLEDPLLEDNNEYDPYTNTSITITNDSNNNPNQHYHNNAKYKPFVPSSLFSYSMALYLVIFASVFQASFFAYVKSSNGRNIEQILYFIRLFSDFIGRPLTLLPRPPWLQVQPMYLLRNIFNFNYYYFYDYVDYYFH